MNPVDFITHHHLSYWLLAVIVRAGAVFLGLYIAYWLGEHMSPAAAAFWKGVLSDSGNPSWSRVASSLLLISCIAWDTLYTVRTNMLPDGGTLSAQALFISSPYLINTGGKAVMMGIANRPSNPPATQPTGDTTTVVVGKG